jgi:hypothetical protein
MRPHRVRGGSFRTRSVNEALNDKKLHHRSVASFFQPEERT